VRIQRIKNEWFNFRIQRRKNGEKWQISQISGVEKGLLTPAARGYSEVWWTSSGKARSSSKRHLQCAEIVEDLALEVIGFLNLIYLGQKR
jgi:hypothetical protein